MLTEMNMARFRYEYIANSSGMSVVREGEIEGKDYSDAWDKMYEEDYYLETVVRFEEIDE